MLVAAPSREWGMCKNSDIEELRPVDNPVDERYPDVEQLTFERYGDWAQLDHERHEPACRRLGPLGKDQKVGR